MADWLLPSARDLYVKIIEVLKGRDEDAATMFFNPPINPILHSIRANRALGTQRFEEWDGNNWVTFKLDASGGGTGADTISGARSNLGIGTMGLQNNNLVNITGGVATGLTVLDMSGNITFFAHDSYSIGTILKQTKNVFISGGLKIPIGIDKWIPK
jgi:hypothetical protein